MWPGNSVLIIVNVLAVLVHSLPTSIGRDAFQYDPNSITQSEKILKLFLQLATHTANHLTSLRNESEDYNCDRHNDSNSSSSTIETLVTQPFQVNLEQPVEIPEHEIQSRLFLGDSEGSKNDLPVLEMINKNRKAFQHLQGNITDSNIARNRSAEATDLFTKSLRDIQNSSFDAIEHDDRSIGIDGVSQRFFESNSFVQQLKPLQDFQATQKEQTYANPDVNNLTLEQIISQSNEISKQILFKIIEIGRKYLIPNILNSIAGIIEILTSKNQSISINPSLDKKQLIDFSNVQFQQIENVEETQAESISDNKLSSHQGLISNIESNIGQAIGTVKADNQEEKNNNASTNANNSRAQTNDQPTSASPINQGNTIPSFRLFLDLNEDENNDKVQETPSTVQTNENINKSSNEESYLEKPKKQQLEENPSTRLEQNKSSDRDTRVENNPLELDNYVRFIDNLKQDENLNEQLSEAELQEISDRLINILQPIVEKKMINNKL